MNLCIKIPLRLKFKRFNKKYSKIRYHIDYSTKSNTIKNSPQFVCGLKALKHGFLSSKLLNSIILLLRRAVGKGRIGWPRVRICFNLRVPVTRKSAGHRMGKGKGSVKYWGVPIKAGSFVFKIRKSPKKSFFFSNFVWTNLYSFFEFLDTTSYVYDKSFSINKYYNFTEFLDSVKTSFKLIKTNLIYIGLARVLFTKYILFIRNLFFYNKNRDVLRLKKKKNAGRIKLIVKKKVGKKPKVFKKKKKDIFFSNKMLYFIKTYLSFFRQKLFNKTITNQINKLFFLFSLYFTKKKFVYLYKILEKKVLRKNKFQLFFNNLQQKKHIVKILHFSKENDNLLKQEDSIYDVSYNENRMLAQYTQTYSETKISYIPSLYRGLMRVKKKLPFLSEIYFTDKRNIGFSFYNAIKRKKRLKHLKQR